MSSLMINDNDISEDSDIQVRMVPLTGSDVGISKFGKG